MPRVYVFLLFIIYYTNQSNSLSLNLRLEAFILLNLRKNGKKALKCSLDIMFFLQCLLHCSMLTNTFVWTQMPMHSVTANLLFISAVCTLDLCQTRTQYHAVLCIV